MHPGRSGRNHLRVQAAAAGLPASRVEEVLALVELTAAAKRRVKGYSLGMRQRLGLATALLGDRRCSCWTSRRTGSTRRDQVAARSLRSLAAEGRTILVSSHVLAEVAQTADDVVIIHRGRLIQQAAIAEVLAGASGSTRVRTPERSACARCSTPRARASPRPRTGAARERSARADRRARRRERDRAPRAEPSSRRRSRRSSSS